MEVPYCIIKGTDFRTTVSLTVAWEEVINNPQGYKGEMVFREGNYPDATVYLTLVSSIETGGDAPAQIHFHANPVQTALLPNYDITAHVDLVSDDAQSRQRLYNSDVELHE